jgi:hypothetical protein
MNPRINSTFWPSESSDYVDRAGDLAIFAFFGFLDGIPKLPAIQHPFGRVAGRKNFFMQNPRMHAVVVPFAPALVLEALPGAIGGRPHGALAFLAGNHRDGKMVLRHGSPGGAVALCVRVHLWTPGAVRRCRRCRGAEPLTLEVTEEQGSSVSGCRAERP